MRNVCGAGDHFPRCFWLDIGEHTSHIPQYEEGNLIPFLYFQQYHGKINMQKYDYYRDHKTLRAWTEGVAGFRM